MSGDSDPIRVTIDVAAEPSAAFNALLDELATALGRHGIIFEPRAAARLTHAGREVGAVTTWEPGERIVLAWRPAPWEPERTTEIELRVEPVDGGTHVIVEHRGLSGVLAGASELTGWFASQLVAPFLAATAPDAMGDWITDRRARRPSGAESRAIYRDPRYHYPNFRVILQELALTPDDDLLEVGCGGGALLREALRSGCRAAAVDHSPDMVREAREVNRDAIAEGRLEIVEASAGSLPFPDARFTCAAMTGVLGFLTDPVAALAEIRRVLAGGGRLVVLGSDPELRGTPGAPEPMASRLRFYEDDELVDLARAAGFTSARAVRRDLEQFAREAGVPDEHVPLFAGTTRFLLARKV
jgi:ubiquinone/menaquinone biosynthesis C-methylase UbiE